jgi:hypothetical protein
MKRMRPETVKRRHLDQLKRCVMCLYRQACSFEGVDYSQPFYTPFQGNFSQDNPYVVPYRDALAKWKAAEKQN